MIDLRWIAVACLASVIVATRVILHIEIPVIPLLGGNGALAAANAVYSLCLPRIRLSPDSTGRQRAAALFVGCQTTLDLILLTYLLHFAGGVENPFLLFYIFHSVMASILLSNRAAYLQATLAVALVAAMAAAERCGLLSHHHLAGLLVHELPQMDPRYLAGILAAFATGVYVTVYMATSTVNLLRRRDHDLAIAVARLEAAMTKLEQKDREKSDYVRTVSHHIKGSLSAVQGCLKVVLDGLVGSVAHQALGMIERAERRSRSLLRFANGLLFLATLRAENRMRKREIALHEIADSIALEMAPVAEQKELTLTVQDHSAGAPVLADPEAVGELLRQLLDNAIKYTPPGGEIHLDVLKPEGVQAIQVSVTDTGTGIAETDLPHIFEDFYSADTSINRETAGAGLGLAVARQVAEMHGGRVDVQSEVGKGSTLRATFPIP